ncbi:Uma2 family endonuclease [Streptomyces hyaluromycini]|uniref:Uma2 family endonuclease n=1 Tax=Streptomyces hyaluromycini TaxID=1377993 RepID=A0ABV1WSV4_9ACTN|nr:Uma2 family endonuclease [Streptomyces hyaluromycini]
MTAVDDRLITDVREIFENLEVPEGFKAELLRGDIVMMAGPGLVHNMIVESVQDQIPRDRWRRLQVQDVDIPNELSEPVPDLVVIERDGVPGSGRLLPSGMITMVVEVVSKNSIDRDYGDKRSIYAAGKVPAYLIIDPMASQCLLLTEPTGRGEEADYLVERTGKFGMPLALDILGIKLDTSEFGTLPPVKRHRRP